MEPSSPIADTTAFYMQEIGALLFGPGVSVSVPANPGSLFRVVGDGLGAAVAGGRFSPTNWCAPQHGMAGAVCHIRIRLCHRPDLGGARRLCLGMKDWRTVLRLISILPIFVALVWAVGWYSRPGGLSRLATPWCWGSSTSTTSSRCARDGAGRADLPLFPAAAGGGVLGARPVFSPVSAIAAARPPGRSTCTTKPTTISPCTACWRLPPWRCGARARSTASATWPANWIICAARASTPWTWTG